VLDGVVEGEFVMGKWLCWALAAVLMSAGATYSADAVTSSAAVRTVEVVKKPRNVTLGARFAVTVRAGAVRQARRVKIQTRTEDLYGNTQWTTVRGRKVNGQARHRFKLVATEPNVQRFRSVVRYRDGKSVTSRPFAVTVWQWVDLARFDAYYETAGIIHYQSSQFPMNGDQYLGWYTYQDRGMWESRYTPGRNCKAFRGTFGVTDHSADGSSGRFTLLADDEVVFESPTLVPGMVKVARVDLAKPYRFAVQARNTSSEGVLAWPAIGGPQFLCSGL
jgi:hypothetical protein